MIKKGERPAGRSLVVLGGVCAGLEVCWLTFLRYTMYKASSVRWLAIFLQPQLSR